MLVAFFVHMLLHFNNCLAARMLVASLIALMLLSVK